MSSRSALVVEDSPIMRQIIVSSLASLPNITSFEAANGFEALKMLPQKSFDIILTDINMPDESEGSFDGIELARRAAKLRPGLRVIYTSGGPPTDGMCAICRWFYFPAKALYPRGTFADDARRP